jgi:hypothetical protein
VTDPYAQARATALALLRKKGRTVSVTRKSGAKNKVTGKLDSGGVQSGSFVGVGLPAGPTAERYVGSLVGKQTLEFYLSAEPGVSFLPQPGDQIAWGGRSYTLVWTSDLNPGGTGSVFTRAYGQV